MISNKCNQQLLNEVLEDFAATGFSQLKESIDSQPQKPQLHQ